MKKLVFLFLLLAQFSVGSGMEGEVRSCCFNPGVAHGCKVMFCQGKKIDKMPLWQKRLEFIRFAYPRFMLIAECSALALAIGLPPFSLGWYFSKRQADQKQQKLFIQLNDCLASESPAQCKQLLEKHIKS